MRLFLAILVFFLFFSVSVSAWELSATAIDSAGTTVRDSGQSLAFTPLSSAIKTADLLPDSFAKVDVPAGELTVKVLDPVGGGTNPLVQASANVVRFMLINTTGQTVNVPGGFVGMVLRGDHLLGGSPVNTGIGTGQKTAKITYTGTFQWRNFSAGTVIGTSVVSSNLTATWAEDGLFLGSAMDTPTLQGDSSVGNFTDTSYLASVAVPAFSWEPGKVMEFHAELNVSATASDPGLSALLDATNTATLSFLLPEGIEVEDAGLMTRADLPWVIAPGRFNDVPPDYWAFSFIETLADTGITAGCGNDNYCPSSPVTRAQMAVFLERGINGSGFSPPAATGNVFLDVPVESFAANFIEQFFLDGITSGCGSNNYCPNADVTRAQMAVFLLRAEHGSGYSPPPATGVFNDVPLNHWAVHWIEQLAVEGITSGCGNGNYCPEATVTRDQMAVFLVRTFEL